ncbi:MAG TPA: phosphate ABC transporter permease [Cyanothece sp. UBA12306]|nr:phosphate ABC transporter permease [Cyanothece sp. UBA12306]
MLLPLTRQTFEEIIPAIATGAQYAHYWGKSKDLLRRLFISLVALTSFWLIGKLLGSGGETVKLIFDIIAGLYWLWGPVYWASLRNRSYRRFPYSGFWQGRVLDVFITEEFVGEEQTVNKRGELVIIENLERRINLEVGDRQGFVTIVQAPIRRIYKVIKPGDIAQMLILSKQPDLSLIDKVTDVYLPQNNLWVGEYPALRRDIFSQVSNDLSSKQTNQSSQKRYPSKIRRRKR